MTDPEEVRKQVLEYEDLVAEVNKKRNPPSRKSWWESPGVLPSLTAVLTVALTSTAAYYTQRSLREEDFLTEQSKSNYEGSVAAISDAHLLANETLYWAGERDRLLHGDYVKFPQGQKDALADSVNASDTNWRRGRASKRVNLDLHFGGDTVVLNAWDATVAKLNEYTSCTVVRPDCANLRAPADSAITRFRDSSVAHLRAARPTIVR